MMNTHRTASGASTSSSGPCCFLAPPSPVRWGHPRTQDRLRGGTLLWGRRLSTSVEAKKRVEEGSRQPRIERLDKSIRFSFQETEIQVPDQALFFSALVLLGFGALLGPLIIGIAVTIVSITAAVTIGAFAISTLFFPFIIMFMLTFGFFSSAALFGLGVMAPQLLGLVAAGGGLAVISFSLLRMVLAQGAAKVPGASSSMRTEASRPPVIEIDPEEEEARRLSQELRDFDVRLADSEYSKRMNKRKS